MRNYIQKDFFYQCRRDELNGTNKDAKDNFNKFLEKTRNQIKKIQQVALDLYPWIKEKWKKNGKM